MGNKSGKGSHQEHDASDPQTCGRCVGFEDVLDVLLENDHLVDLVMWHAEEVEDASSPEDAYRILRPLVWNRTKEKVAVIAIDSKCKVVDKKVIGAGNETQSFMAPSIILKWALTRDRAVRAVIVGHNHPSGNPKPSSEDIETTKRLAKACKIVGIYLYDHIVVGVDNFVSIKEYLQEGEE